MRMIPENPKDGERRAILNGDRWEVYGPEKDKQGQLRCIADGVTEEDARLLVYGKQASQFAKDLSSNYDHEECYHLDNMASACCRTCKAEELLILLAGENQRTQREQT